MPGMDGFAATRAIRAAQGNSRRVPIVALTAHAVAEVREQCLREGMDDYLSKPFAVAELGARLAKWLRPLLDGIHEGIRDDGSHSWEPVPPPADAESGGRERLDIEWQRLANLDDGTAESGKMVRDLIRLFEESWRNGLSRAREARERGDAVSLAKTLHKLKGSCGTLGARSLHDAIAELEGLDPAGTDPRFLGGLERIGVLAERTSDAFHRRYPDSLETA